MDDCRLHTSGTVVAEPRYVDLSHLELSIDHQSECVGIRILNLWLVLPILTASINGLDSSLVNGEYSYESHALVD